SIKSAETSSTCHTESLSIRTTNIWVRAALHQVFKIPSQEYEPALVLGEKFTPGNDASHFCKPTDVAVASNGVFFVADGYCNSRLMKFAPDGMLMEILDQGEFDTPHSLALIEEEDLICVADREHHSIRCFSAGLYNPKDVGVEKQTINDPRLGRVYAIDYANGNLYAVNGPEADSPAHGFTIDVSTGEIKETWQPAEGFGSPHDVTASWTGTEVYVGDIGKNRPWKFQR
ncbi:PREDICTED: peptidyl-alpha-hydroxyglycine alpha-amidating lyase 2-like, partial [Priapulus caudatus]|uniref:Peptidyl-alpha-hydroxyglycine alpha-amidating lyase 2-like n=1 Tax=Priapulus caudatus TaxID=37621 RepID=A0ABM1EV27_PRICU